MNLSKRIYTWLVSGATTANATDVVTTAVTLPDGGESVTWIVAFSGTVAITTNTPPRLKVDVSDDNSNWTEVTDASVTIVAAMASKQVAVELAAPHHKYARLTIVKTGVSNTIGTTATLAIVHNGRIAPDSNAGDLYSSNAATDNVA